MKKKHYLLLVVFVLITFFANRSALPTDIMETRNIVTAREMVEEGHWLVPTMNGELRLEKPPLPTWVAGIIEWTCPNSLSAQRAAPALMGCIWTLYLFLMVKYVSKRDDLAVVSVMVFLTCYNVVLMGRSATWDIYCHAFMMAAIYYLTRALYESHHYRQRFALAGLFMGLSFLSKGPVSFYTLLLPYLITLIGLPEPTMKGKWKSLWLMVAIAIVVGGWWYIYLLVAHKAEVQAVIGKESGAWSHHNVRPWWYYWRFFLEMGAWAILMLASLAITYWKRNISLKREYLMAITWTVASLVLLSLMPEKKMRYLLPAMAPASVVVGCLIVNFCQGEKMDKVGRWLYVINGLTVSIIAVAVPVLAYHFGLRHGLISMGTEVGISAVMVCVAVWLVWCTLQCHPLRLTCGIAAMFALAELCLLGTIGHAFGNPEANSIAAVQTDKRLAGLPFYHNEEEPLRIELVYEAHRKILPLCLGDSAAVLRALPCAIVSRRWVSEEVPAAVLQHIDTVAVGTYDDNKHPRNDRHYTQEFINHVTILKLRK